MIEKIEYKGWAHCYKMSNSQVELILTTDFGPRIARFAFIGGENILFEHPDEVGKTGGDVWRSYCGHRLSIAPESCERSYVPDNHSIQIEPQSLSARLFQYTDRTTGIQKEFTVYLDPYKASVRISHHLCNNNLWPVELAACAITEMARGGVGILPLANRRIHDPDVFHPPHSLMIWNDTNMNDARWTWGQRYMLLRDDQTQPDTQRAGSEFSVGWSAYKADRQLFVKKFTVEPGKKYAYGCPAVLFTAPNQYQMETLSPLTTLKPKETLEYIEEWALFDNIPDIKNEADIDRFVLPKMNL